MYYPSSQRRIKVKDSIMSKLTQGKIIEVRYDISKASWVAVREDASMTPITVEAARILVNAGVPDRTSPSTEALIPPTHILFF